MVIRNDYKRLKWLALYIAGEDGINNAPNSSTGALGAVVQYWGNQANISAIFATIFSSIFITFFIQQDINLKIISIPSFIVSLYFMVRAWAFNVCAGIACSAHK